MALERLCFDADTVESEGVYRERIETFPDGFLVLEDGPEPFADDARGELPRGVAGFVSSELWRRPAAVDANLFTLGHSILERFDSGGDELYVSSLAVDPASRGKGYGNALFTALLERIRAGYPNVRSAILLVAETWPGARSIYERAGFMPVAELAGFFGGRLVPPYGGTVMRRPIGG